MIDKSKRYVTQDGRSVKIYNIEQNGTYPVHGAVFDPNDGFWTSFSWTVHGNNFSGKELCTDLVEDELQIREEIWLNVYRKEKGAGHTLVVHTNTSSANNICSSTRVACLKVLVEGKEGDGND